MDFRPINSTEISQETAFRALRHLPLKVKNDLFSKNEHLKRNATGYWYEAAIYESLLKSAFSDHNYKVIAKWADVPKWKRRSPKLGQNGLFYDESGALVARGNGQDLGEFDLLIANGKETAFVEAFTSDFKLGKIVQEIDYKRRLMKALFSNNVQSVLISCLNLRNKTSLATFRDERSNFLVVTGGLKEFLLNLKPQDVFKFSPINIFFKQQLLSNLETVRINYLDLHNKLRENIEICLATNQEICLDNSQLLVKRVIIGYLDNSTLEGFLQKVALMIGERRVTSANLKFFSRVILSLSIPTFRPTLYLRVLDRSVYLKMGPFASSSFGFENNIRQKRTAFFNWLECVDYKASFTSLNKILNRYMNEKNIIKRRKKSEKPDLPYSFFTTTNA